MENTGPPPRRGDHFSFVNGLDLKISSILSCVLHMTVAAFNNTTGLLIWMMASHFVNPGFNTPEKLLYYVLSSLLVASQAFNSLATFTVVFLMLVLGKAPDKIVEMFDYTCYSVDEWLEARQREWGHNADDYTAQIGEWLKERWKTLQILPQYLDNLTGYVEVTWIREIRIQEPYVDYTDREFHAPREVLGFIQMAKSRQTLLLAIVLVVTMLFVPRMEVAVLAILVAAYQLKDYTDDVERYDEPRMTFRNGVYRARKYVLGILTESSIAVGFQGVLHATKHATGDVPLIYNSQFIRPTVVDSECDIVTWFGEPQIVEVREDDDVYMVTQRETGSTTYKVDKKIDGSHMTVPLVTVPGESGSPILVRRGDRVYLAGLAGTYARLAGIGSEVVTRPASSVEVELEIREGQVIKEARHPGSGKTFHMIPKLCSQILSRKKTATIIVTGPTRVVCKEILKALKARLPGTKIGTLLKGHTRSTGPHFRVVVGAHATIARKILEEAPLISRSTHFIVDESHVDDVGTEIVKNYCEGMASNGLTSWFLSATHPGFFDRKSNYPILDVKITRPDKAVKDYLAEGKRVLMFVSSHTAAVRAASQHAEARPIILVRQTYEQVKNKLDDQSRRLIVATNIAECGINLDVDVVVDTCMNFYYKAEGNRLVGVCETISQASQIQRRGRVGRNKAGIYCYTEEAQIPHRTDTSSQYEASMMCKRRAWYRGPDMAPTIQGLTSRQAIRAMEVESTLLAWLLYDGDGRLRSPSDKQETIREWMSGRVKPPNSRTCQCARFTYTRWDDRDAVHDRLEQLLGH